uniref:Uncharacterized protein n=1 Tax=Hyaloperonospora arabidopsidis (strain Emoy2) TaxID=559515 RepID=M4BEW7_HYAAE
MCRPAEEGRRRSLENAKCNHCTYKKILSWPRQICSASNASNQNSTFTVHAFLLRPLVERTAASVIFTGFASMLHANMTHQFRAFFFMSAAM